MTGDIWGMFGKKKDSNTLTIPSKKTTNTSYNTSTTTQQTIAQPVKVKAPRVKPHKVQKQKVQHASVTEPNIDDFNVSTSADANGIYVTILYQNHTIYKFSLFKNDFDLWQYRMDANQRMQYVKVRVNANATAFGNNAQIVQTVIMSIYNILTNIFNEAARMRAQQQAQARRNMI
jgi:hypothetical protein